jgi:hypothetical protein
VLNILTESKIRTRIFGSESATALVEWRQLLNSALKYLLSSGNIVGGLSEAGIL